MIKKIRELTPDIIGIGFETRNRKQGFDTIRIAKLASPKSIIISGGVHSTMTTQDLLENISQLNIVVRGEGEQTMLELCKAIQAKECDLSNIIGISFRHGKDIIHNSDRPFIHNLDKLPFPAYHFFSLCFSPQLRKGIKAIPVATSRGCPFNCSFCGISAFWHGNYRAMSSFRVIEEITHLVDRYKVKKIYFEDSSFTLNPNRAREICNGLIKIKNKNNHRLSWQCNIRADKNITKGLLAYMKEAGCKGISMGVESGSSRILTRIRKMIDLEDVKRIAEWCSQMNLSVYCFFSDGFSF